MSDSPRWCEACNAFGNHHTDRHPPETAITDIKRLHALVLAGKNASAERDDKIRELAGAEKCPTCDGTGDGSPAKWITLGWTSENLTTVACPDCNGTGQPPTQTAIATELGVSRQAIGQIVGKTG